MNEVSIQDAYQYCPRCAAKNKDVGSIPFRCHACGFAIFFGPVAAVGGLITNAQNQLLLVRRAIDPGKGKWGLPGGFVDRNETIEDALAREVFEETKLVIKSRKLLMTHPNGYRYGGIIVSVIDMFFVCKVCKETNIELEEGELNDYRWVDANSELFQQMAFESNRIATRLWRAMLFNAVGVQKKS